VNFRRDRIQVSLSGLNKLRVRDKTFPAPINSINARGARCHFDPVEVEHLVEDKKAARNQQPNADE
jgi:prophage regulatory protein